MTFTFHQLIEHVTRSRRLSAGTIIGSGTVSNEDRSAGSACIAERRAIELIEQGEPRTPFMRFGDRVRVEMLDTDGASVFGAIDQRIVSLEEALAGVRRDPDGQGRAHRGGEGRGRRRGPGDRRGDPRRRRRPWRRRRPRLLAHVRRLGPRSFRLSDEEIEACVAAVPEQTVEDIRFAQDADPAASRSRSAPPCRTSRSRRCPGVVLGHKQHPGRRASAATCPAGGTRWSRPRT